MNIKSTLLGVLLTFNLLVQQDSSGISFNKITSNIYNDIKLSIDNILSFYAAPGQLSSTDWVIATGIVASTYGLMHADQNFYNNYLKSRDTRILNSVGYKFLTKYGEIMYANSLGAATYLTGLFIQNDFIKITGRVLLEGLFISGLTAITLRTFFGRSRPYYEQNPWKFNWFVFNEKMDGFPSGHTTVAFTLSTILAERIDKSWARVLFYGIATLNTVARVYSDEHWMSDAVLGSLIGFGTGIYVINRERCRIKNELDKSRILFAPTINGFSIIIKLD